MLRLAIVKGQVVVDLGQLVGLIGVLPFAPIIKVHCLVENAGKGRGLTLTQRLTGRLVVHRQLVIEYTQLYSAGWLVQVFREFVVIDVPAIELSQALIDLLQVAHCERHFVISKFLAIHLSVAAHF